MMNVAIPSAWRADKRARSIEQLDALAGEAEVTWWVPDIQRDEYRRWLPRWMAVQPVPRCDTVNVARNAIHADYAGEDVVVLEDDVPWYVGSRHVWDPALHSGPPSSPRLTLPEVARLGFAALDVTGLSAWGLYPVAYSGTQLKPRVGVGCLFLVGHTVGLRIPSGGLPRLNLEIKEDYELSAQQIQATGGVVRLDAICAYTKSGVGSGGTNTYRGPEVEANAADSLMMGWPEMFEHKPTERNGLPQVKMVGPVTYTELRPEEGWQPYAGK